jgi:hypothetical protein
MGTWFNEHTQAGVRRCSPARRMMFQWLFLWRVPFSADSHAQEKVQAFLTYESCILFLASSFPGWYYWFWLNHNNWTVPVHVLLLARVRFGLILDTYVCMLLEAIRQMKQSMSFREVHWKRELCYAHSTTCKPLLSRHLWQVTWTDRLWPSSFH